jgi:hypothetical protein
MGFLLQYRNVDIRSNKVYHSVNQNAGRETRVLLDAGNLTVWGHVVTGKQCSISPVRPSNPPGTIHHINSAWGLSPSLPTVLYYLGCTIEIASCKRNEYSSVEEWLKARRARMMCTGLGLLSNDRVSVPSALEHENPTCHRSARGDENNFTNQKLRNASQTRHFSSTIEL